MSESHINTSCRARNSKQEKAPRRVHPLQRKKIRGTIHYPSGMIEGEIYIPRGPHSYYNTQNDLA